MRFHFSVCLFLLILVSQMGVAQGQTLRIANYNMLDKPTSGAESADLRTIIGAIGDYQLFGNQRQVDVFMFQEGPLATSAYNFVESDFETVFGGDYELFYASQDSSGDRTGVVYNASRLTILSWDSVDNMGFTHPPTLVTMRPTNSTAPEDVFSVISVHLKAGSSGSDFTRRTNEANSIGDLIDSLGTNANVVVAGDFNMQGSTENAWAAFAGDGLKDTLNAPYGLRVANWNEEIAFLPFHSQETSGTFGGMDDRFDFQLVTSAGMDDVGFEYVKGSVSVLGNNGTHSLNGSLFSGTGSAAIQDELVDYSDHLPVFADYTFGGTGSSATEMLNVGAAANFTVQPTGPREEGSGGFSFVNVEGDGNGNFASFAVVDFDLTSVIEQGDASDVTDAGITLLQSNAGFTQDGPYSIYLASAAATTVTIDNSIQYQEGNNGLNCLPSSLRQGAVKLSTYPGVHRTNSGALLPDGTVDDVGIYGPAIDSAIMDAINQDGTIRLLIVPDHDSTAATFAGNTNVFHSGPVLFADYSGVTLADVAVTSFLVTQGMFVTGDEFSLSVSDNADFSIQRASTDVLSRTQLEVGGVSFSATPNTIEVTLETSVFARTTVNQFIQLYNFDTGSWEQIDSREAARFSDATVSAAASGDLSRFVEAGTLAIRARIVHQSPTNRQRFTSHHDQFFWTIGS